MRSRLCKSALRPAGRVVALTFIAGFAAACSSDSGRFGENPFGNPFQGKVAQRSDGMTTGSIARPARPKSNALPESNAGVTAPTYIGSASNWSAEGGTPVTLGSGDTVMTLANRYGVPPQAILQANGLRSASDARVGQTLTIPVYKSAATAGSGSVVTQPLPPRLAPVASAPAPHQAVAMQAMTPTKPPVLGHSEAVATKAPAKVAVKAKNTDSDDEDDKPAKAPVKPQAKLSAKAVPAPIAKAMPAKPVKEEIAAAPVKPIAKQELPKPEPKAKQLAVVQPKAVEPVKPEQKAAAPAPAEQEQTGSLPKGDDASSADFRWPARGRVISAYTKGGNDGINIAVPEGTPVKAADGGTVAYAGSELKGYGNLVLIRHPNGYVSAYAHNGELNVKRGQTVSRGQVIAKSGQSGNVSSPQLHFELRKGATPIDPTPYLN